MEANTKPSAVNRNSRQNLLVLLLFIALIIIMILLLVQCNGQKKESGPSQTAVIEQNETEERTETGDGSIRIVISPSVRILEDTMQNLYFCNYNKERLLRCRIRAGEDYIYDSGMLPEGSELIGDFVRTDTLVQGANQAVAEIYSYDMDENPVGQTNVNIVLHLE